MIKLFVPGRLCLLTAALEAVRSRVGMMGVRLYSQRFDMGNPTALVNTVAKFSHLKKLCTSP